MQIEVSNGELVDKLTIIELKVKYIKNSEQQNNLQKELKVLSEAVQLLSGDFQSFYKDLSEVNHKLWQIEDEIRECEEQKDFGPKFIDLARSIYKLNDQRAQLKKQINFITKSDLVEEKSYKSY